MTQVTSRHVTIAKSDVAKQIVYGVVYAPNEMDTEGEFMFAEDIETMAHEFLRLKLDETIDTGHDRVPNGCFPVESFVARANDPDYPEGAWVLGVKCTDDMWDKYQRGEINGFSFEALVEPVDVEIEVETYRDHFGLTEASKSAAGEDHDHAYFVHVNENGLVLGGWTSPGPDGHVHGIIGASKTMAAGLNNHNHRFQM